MSSALCVPPILAPGAITPTEVLRVCWWVLPSTSRCLDHPCCHTRRSPRWRSNHPTPTRPTGRPAFTKRPMDWKDVVDGSAELRDCVIVSGISFRLSNLFPNLAEVRCQCHMSDSIMTMWKNHNRKGVGSPCLVSPIRLIVETWTGSINNWSDGNSWGTFQIIFSHNLDSFLCRGN